MNDLNKVKPKPKPLIRAQSMPAFKLNGVSGAAAKDKQQHLQVASPSDEESRTDTTNSPQLKKKPKPKPLLRVESVPIFNLSGENTEEKTKQMPKPKPLLRGQSLPIFNLTGDKTAEVAKQKRFVSESSTLRMSGTSVEYKKQEITDKPIGSNGVFRQYLRGRPITMFAPSDSADHGAKKEPTLPTEMLRAEWVYGYRGRDCADNLHELASGEVVYNIASVVALYDPRAGTQRHYLGHNSSIQCLAVHPAGVLVTSGQVMGVNRREQIAVYEKFDGFYETPDPNWYKPHVRVWDSKTLQTLAVIGGGKLQFGVCAVSFSVSDGGCRVLAVDDSPGKILTVWDWKNGNLLCEAVATRDLLETAAFHPMDSDMIVTAGKNHLGFWTIKKITAGSSSKAFLTMKKGLFAEHQAKFVHCLDFGDNGDVITGDSKGSILVWKKGCNRISHANPVAHKGGIMALRVLTSEGTLVTGGGKDRRVVVWDRSFTRQLRECKLDKALGGVRSICTAEKSQMFSGNGLFLGTLSNALCHWTLDLETVEAVSKGHADELWGLAAHPRKPQFVTCDYSGLVVLWESKTHRPVWRTQLKFAAQSAQFHPTEEILLIGTTAGRWYCMDASSAAVIEEYQPGEDNKQLDCLRFSPDGAILAVGSHDNHIYLYNVENHGKSYKKTTRLSGHSSFVTHLDFSTDGRYMQSTSGDYELLYWDVAARSQLQFKSAMRDVTWDTQTCVFGFHVFGMWQQGADGHDILSCAASGSRALLASADTHGKVNLFRFPCSTFQSPGHVYPGHGSHVTSVTFLPGDDWLISTGGMDCSVIQWQVVRPAPKLSTKRTHKDYNKLKPPPKCRQSSTSMLAAIDEFLPEDGGRNGERAAVTDASTQTSRPSSPDKTSRHPSPQPPPDPVQEENKIIQELVDSLFLNN